MHIAYVTDQRYPAKGTDTAQIVTMCAALGSAGAKVTLYHLSDDPDTAVDAEQLAAHYEVPSTFHAAALPCPPQLVRGLEKLTHARRAARRIAENGADLLYSRNLPSVMAGLWLTDRPTFYETYRPWPDQSRSKALLFRALRPKTQLRGLVLHSQLAAKSYRRVGYDSPRLLVALNGYCPSALGRPLTRAQARRRLGLADRFTVTYGGDVMPSKGLGTVLDIAERMGDVQFLLVGSKAQGPIEERAEKMSNVHVFSWRPMSEVTPYLYAADVLIIPPTATPLKRAGHTVLPIKSFHYLATGRPVLAADTPDIREVIEDGRNGVLVNPEDITGSVRALRELMTSPDRLRQLSENALADGRSRTWAARADRVLAYLESRLSRPLSP